MLLGNMDEVSEISQKILTNLETATSGIDFDEQVIGNYCSLPTIIKWYSYRFS